MRLGALCLGLFTLGSVAHAASYTVSPSGNDANDGSSAHPWKTLQHAADSVVAGDTVDVLAGTYAGFVLGWNGPQDGTQSMPITFHAESGVLINAPNAHTQDCIDLEGTSYITVEGFETMTCSRAGIRTVSNGTSNATGVVVRNNHCHDHGTWGIFTSHVDNLLIVGNTCERSQTQHGIYVSNACVNPTVRGNTLVDNYAAGLHMNGDISQGGNGIIAGALVEDNVITGNGAGGGSGINCDGLYMSRIQNNLITDEHASGISLYQIDAAQPARSNVIVNNTIELAADGRWAINIQNASVGNSVINNILLDDNASHGSIDISTDSLSGFTSDHNVTTGVFTTDGGNTHLTLAQWQAQTGQDMHSLVATAAQLFVGGGDYHLSATSPAIDQGTSTDAPSVDIVGVTRPQGAAIDIGAYEYTTAATGDMGAMSDMTVIATSDMISAMTDMTSNQTDSASMPSDMTSAMTDSSTNSTDGAMPPLDDGGTFDDIGTPQPDDGVPLLDGGTRVDATPLPGAARDGCGCIVGGKRSNGGAAGWAVAIGMIALGLRRRRRAV